MFFSKYVKLFIYQIVFIACFISFNSCLAFSASCEKAEYADAKCFEYLSFEELVNLSKNEHPAYELKNKLSRILYNPIVENNISTNTELLNNSELLGDYIRVASWNIARGLNIESIITLFKNPEELFKNIKLDNEELQKIKQEAEILRNANIIFLNEVDIGMPRTGYKNIAKELAESLGFNYAYGVEFIEIDPTHLGLEKHEWSEEAILFPNDDYVVDKDKYKGFHGNAILSRYPLKNVRIIRLPNYYDWFNDEQNKIANVEVLRRKAADLLFREDVIREIRHGSRMALIAEATIPGVEKPVTLICAHLENRALPKYRYQQMKVLLKSIECNDNVVILGGDMNTTGTDGAPVSITGELKKKITDTHFLSRQAVLTAVPYTTVVSALNTVTNFIRLNKNPTVYNIPIILPNHERKLFRTLKNFEFADGLSFDFSGPEYRTSSNWEGYLGASNERILKGYKPTFLFRRHYQIIGQYKLDWIFVKPIDVKKEGEKIITLQPFNGRTLLELNYAFGLPLSDHTPITVDLPINPPSKKEVINYLNKDKRFKLKLFPDFDIETLSNIL